MLLFINDTRIPFVYVVATFRGATGESFAQTLPLRRDYVFFKSSGEIRFRAHKPNSFKSYFQRFYAGYLRVVKLQVYSGLHFLTYLP